MTSSPSAPASSHTLTTSITPDVLMGAFAQILIVQPGHVMPGEKKLSRCGLAQAKWLGEEALIEADLVFLSNNQIVHHTIGEILLATQRDECDQCFVGELDLPTDATHPVNVMLMDLGNTSLRNPAEGRSLFGHRNAQALKRWGLDMTEAIMEKSGDKYNLWAIMAPSHVVGVQMLAWILNEIMGDRNPNYQENKSLVELIVLKHGEAFRVDFLPDDEPYSIRISLFTQPGA